MRFGDLGIGVLARGLASGRRLILVSVLCIGVLGCPPGTDANQPPSVAIIQPLEGASFASGQTITFEATYSDREDGRLIHDSLATWATASGAFGHGLRVARTDLPVGTHEVTFTGLDSKGARGTTSVRLSVTQPPVSTSTSSVSVSNSTVAAGTTVNITLQAKSLAGNNIVTGGRTVVFSASGGTSTGVISATTDNANGTYTASFTGTTAGTPTTIGATIDGMAVATPLPSVAVTPGPAAFFGRMGTDTTGLDAGANWDSLRVVVRDCCNNFNAGVVVIFAVTTGGGALSATNVTTGANGQAAVRFTTGTVVGVNTARAAVTGLSGSPQTFSTTTVPGPAVSIAKVGTDPTEVVAGANWDSMRVIVKDANANPKAGVAVTFAVTVGGGTLSATSVTTGSNGQAAVRLLTGVVAGLNTATATVTGVSGSPVSFSTTTVSGPPARLTYSPKVIVLDSGSSTSAASVTVRDGAGNVVQSPSVTYAPRSGAVASVSSSGVVGGLRSGQSVIVATATGGNAPSDSILAIVAIPTGPVLRTDIGLFEYKSDTVFSASVVLDMRSSGELLSSAQLAVAWSGSAISYQSHEVGSSGLVLANRAASGDTLYVAFSSASGAAGVVELVRITFRASSTVGASGHLALSSTELANAALSNLLPKTVAATYALATR